MATARTGFKFLKENKKTIVFYGKVVIAIGCSVPLSMYLIPLPQDMKGVQYHWISRFHIWRAGMQSKADDTKIHLRKALEYELDLGKGVISPEVNRITLYLVNRYLSEEANLSQLRMCFESLKIKPHVGEGVIEEAKRVDLAFKVVDRLAEKLLLEDKVNEAKDAVKWALDYMENPPSYIKGQLEIPSELKEKFQGYLEKAINIKI